MPMLFDLRVRPGISLMTGIDVEKISYRTTLLYDVRGSLYVENVRSSTNVTSYVTTTCLTT